MTPVSRGFRPFVCRSLRGVLCCGEDADYCKFLPVILAPFYTEDPHELRPLRFKNKSIYFIYPCLPGAGKEKFNLSKFSGAYEYLSCRVNSLSTACYRGTAGPFHRPFFAHGMACRLTVALSDARDFRSAGFTYCIVQKPIRNIAGGQCLLLLE